MIAKLISQALLATSLLQLLPVDAAYFEWQADAGSSPAAQGIEDQRFIGSRLPRAEDRVVPNYPVKIDTDSYGIVTSAQSALVTDAQSGMVLLAKRPNDVRAIGSVTKLMTAMIFLETDPNLSRFVELNPETDLVTGGRIYLAFYDALSLENVLGASLVGSDNTATESLVRFSGMDKEAFIARMNEKAKELGMESTVFTDPTGIDATNVSTASDLLLLLQEAEHFPEIQSFMRTETLQIPQSSGRLITIENTNTLLSSYLNDGDFSVVGGKTGYLPQAGYVLATSVAHGDDTVHVIVLGTESKDARAQEAKGLAAWAFRVFSWPKE